MSIQTPLKIYRVIDWKQISEMECAITSVTEDQLLKDVKSIDKDKVYVHYIKVG